MVRIIARLDVKPPFVVKPICFEGLRKVGAPRLMALKYYEQGADEIFYFDIVASLYRREVLFSEIEAVAEGVFVPFAVGGGIQSIEDCSQLFHRGVDKIVINTSALHRDRSIIDQAAKQFGSQAVTVHIQAKQSGDDWQCYTDCGRIPAGISVSEWAIEVQSRGAGEIVLSSVDNDGRKRGFDLRLLAAIRRISKVPLVAASGAGNKEDVLNCVKEISPEGVAVGSLLHYDIETVQSLKKYLAENRVEIALT